MGPPLLAEQTGNNKILYLYDGTGLIGFKRNGVTYTYVYNGLEDVMEILDKDGNAVVSYLYDAWGRRSRSRGRWPRRWVPRVPSATAGTTTTPKPGCIISNRDIMTPLWDGF